MQRLIDIFICSLGTRPLLVSWQGKGHFIILIGLQ